MEFAGMVACKSSHSKCACFALLSGTTFSAVSADMLAAWGKHLPEIENVKSNASYVQCATRSLAKNDNDRRT